MRSVQKRVNIRMTRAHRTISYWASTVLANRPPLRLVIECRNWLYRFKNRKTLVWGSNSRTGCSSQDKKELETLFDIKIHAIWQHEWENCGVSTWTREVVPRVPDMGCSVIKVNFYLSQGLTEHGAFGTYLKSIRKLPNDTCRCGRNKQSAAHVFKEWSRYNEGRPETWEWTEKVRRYLISTMIKLWRE